MGVVIYCQSRTTGRHKRLENPGETPDTPKIPMPDTNKWPRNLTPEGLAEWQREVEPIQFAHEPLVPTWPPRAPRQVQDIIDAAGLVDAEAPGALLECWPLDGSAGTVAISVESLRALRRALEVAR